MFCSLWSVRRADGQRDRGRDGATGTDAIRATRNPLVWETCEFSDEFIVCGREKAVQGVMLWAFTLLIKPEIGDMKYISFVN